MKVSIKKETNIIDIPEQEAINLVEITPDGHFKYDILYRADPKKAIQNESILVKIYASTKPFTKQPSKLLTQNNPDQIIKNLLQKSSINKDQGRSQVANVFYTYISDISSKIPNDKTTALSFKRKIQGVVASTTLRTDKLVKLKSVQEITDTNVIMPVLENNISTSVVSSDIPRSTGTSRAVSLDLSSRRAIDPAQVSGARMSTIQSARRVSGGIISQPTRNLTRLALNETQRVSLIGNLVNDVNPSNNLQLRPTDFLNVLVDGPRTTLDITETLEIPTGLIQVDEFFLIFQLTNKAGVEIQTINVTVPHAKNVANLQIPTVPPKMMILQSGIPGKNVVQVKQSDPNASGVAVYRKEIKKGLPVIDSAYTFIGNIQARFGQDFQRLEDSVNNYNPVIYRGIPYNTSGVLSSEFESAGAQAIKRKPSGRYERKHNFVSVIGEIVSNAISVEIRDVPPGVCLVKLLKRNLSIFQQEFTLVAKPTLVTNLESGAPIFTTDNDVKEDRIYEYQVELLYPDGTAEIASNNLVIKYEPVTANIVETAISKPVVEQTGADIDVTFDLSSSIIPGDLDFIKQTLESQGLLSFYQDGIADEKEKLQSIIAYGVKRINVTTGETEDFGIVADKLFSDRKFGTVKSVKPLQGGYEYRYVITTYFRKAETTMEQVTRTTQFTQNLSYTFKPAKWLHPVTLKKGNLTSPASRAKNHAQTVFSFGAVGSAAIANVSLANILPSITETHVQKLGKNSNLVQWRVQGQITKIDHFIIVLEMLGMRTVVGKSHNVSESNYFQFVDPLDNGEHGKLTYYIIPVFYDFSRGTEVPTNEVIV